VGVSNSLRQFEQNFNDNLEKNSLLRQQLSDAQQAIVQKKTEYDLSLEEKMALIRQNDKTISLLQERVTMLEGNLTKNIEENEGLQNDKQHLATQISHLVDAKLFLEGKLGHCEKDLYSKDEELASLHSKVIELENSNRCEMNSLANTEESTDSRMNAVSDVEPPDPKTNDDEDPILVCI
jgi:chromosome segregation ATPase